MKTVAGKRAEVKVCENSDEFASETAKEFVRIINESIAARGRCIVALSGGSTPALLYNRLISSEFKAKVDWSSVHFFVSDERCVPLEDKESNFGNAERQFLSKLNLPAENLHPVTHQDTAAADAALEYEELIKTFFGLKVGEFPQFDLILLGMGPDGHCASLFPNTKALSEGHRIAVENRVDKLQAMRITFTFPTLNHARNVIFMVQGSEKSYVLGEALSSDTVSYPVQHVLLENGSLQWIIDRSAAADFLNRDR